MKKLAIVFLVLSMTALCSQAIPVSFDLSGVANKDVVYESGGRGSAQPFGSNPNGTHAFGEDGFVNGFPANKRVLSGDVELGSYFLLPYDTPNVIELCTHSSVGSESFLIDIPNHLYTKIGMLVSAVDGDVSFTIKLQYEDGTTDTLWWEADDWYDLGPRGNTQKVLRELDRVDTVSGNAEDSNHFYLYEFILDEERGIRPDKKLQSITVGSDPNRWPDDQLRFGGIFAISGAAVQP